MTSSKAGMDDFTENVPRAKRDLVMRFVKDQEALQTSQVDLKIVDDETIDLIDSALVVKGEDTKITNPDGENVKREQNPHRPLSKEISTLSLDSDKANEAIIVPRPPSGRPRTRSSSSRKRSVSSMMRRQRSVETENSAEKSPSKDEGNNCCNFRDVLAQESGERTELTSSPNTDEEGAEVNLNASWPQEFLSRKFFDPLQNHSVYASREASYYYNAPVENFSGIDIHSEARALRPRSSQSFQRVRPGEILSARISSASECDRITCNASSLTNPTPYARKLTKSSRRRTYINFNRLDAQLALEGPLELEPVHPSEIPLYRSSSAASSSAPYTMVHVPPIGREGPAPSSS
ncbi:uncharacterized protein LOC144635935 [Oculina patagonica]